ncbi:uncharacterized protein EV420DRAFT_1485621 [Desarmillaria tabescens]|uniref:Uncharacterized protein n=1 Tax=Armillaria tabescens TaxID=1929756 RepID=A0AA39JEV0_ARMTA|nr:uncharacterized protein EV420DRAFT_1485621 [Desarmillaria tabescens]KAK0441456.1 hypothetical protein EV420DRAFT_1485621 [Desarmillaria tabescens]
MLIFLRTYTGAGSAGHIKLVPPPITDCQSVIGQQGVHIIIWIARMRRNLCILRNRVSRLPYMILPFSYFFAIVTLRFLLQVRSLSLFISKMRKVAALRLRPHWVTDLDGAY